MMAVGMAAAMTVALAVVLYKSISSLQHVIRGATLVNLSNVSYAGACGYATREPCFCEIVTK